MQDGDPFFTTYDVTMSTRIYPNDTATTFTSLPQQSTTVEIKKPNTDLASLYEEQQPETSAETVTYFDSTFKFPLSEYESDSTIPETERGFQRARGGYKLYGDANAEDRWFFNLALELPTAKFITGNILYQWITYEFQDSAFAHLNGAAACKIEVGNYQKTSSD